VYAFDTIDGVRNFGVGKIHDARSYGASKIEGARSYGVKKIDGARTYGLDKLTLVADFGTRSAGRLLDNQAGRIVVGKMDQAIQMADHYVDQYLPEGACKIV